MSSKLLVIKSARLATIFLFIFSIVALQSHAQVLTVSASTGITQACVNIPSSNPDFQQFTVSGTGLTASAVATAPTGFEVSLSTASGFASSVSLVPAAGTISNTTIYVRLAALPTAGLRTGNVTVSSIGATSKTVSVSGRVYALPTMAAVSNKVFEHATTSPEIPFTSTSGGMVFNWTNTNTTIGLAASGQGNIPSFTAANTGLVPVQSTITVTPVSTGFAFIPSGNVIKVVSTGSRELVKTITVGSTPTGVAVSPDGTKAFVSNSGSDNVTVININTLEVVATIAVGSNPTDVVVSPNGTRVYVLNTDASTVSVINTASNAVITTIPITASLPSRLAIHPLTNRLYVSGVSQISEVNTTTNAQVNTYTIGNALTVITGMAVDPVGGYVYVSDGGVAQNKVHVLTIDFGLVVQGSINTPAGPDGIVISPEGLKAYIAISDNDAVAIADLSTRTIITSVAAGEAPEWLALSPDGNYLYAQSNFFTGKISVVNTVTRQSAGELDFISNGGSGNFISAGTGCSGTPITFTITVNPKLPEITVSEPVGAIVACEGEASADPQVASVTISGVNMKSGITVTAPVNFQVSFTSSSGFASSLIIPASGSVVAEQTIYIRSSASAPAGELTGSIALTATDAVTQNVTVHAWVSALPTVDPVSDYVFKTNVTTDEIVFTGNATAFDWTNNNPSIGLPASGSGSIPGFLGAGGEEAPNEATITVTPKFMVSGLGCSGPSTTFKITIGPPPPTIISTRPKGYIQSCQGNPETNEVQQFFVSATRLEGDVIVTAPETLQVSLSKDTGFGSSLTLTAEDGEVDSVLVYVRASALTPAGELDYYVELSTVNGEPESVRIKGFVDYNTGILEVVDQVWLHGEKVDPIFFTGGQLTYSWTNTLPAIGLPASGTGHIASFIANNPGTEPITASITIETKSAVYAYIPSGNPMKLLVLNTETQDTVKSIPLKGTGGVTMTFSLVDAYVYIASGNFLNIVNTRTNERWFATDMEGSIMDMVMNTEGTRLYMLVTGLGLVELNTWTNQISVVTPDCCGAAGASVHMALDDQNEFLYLSTPVSATEIMLSKVDLATHTVVRFQAVTSQQPTAPELVVVQNKLYVITGDKTITVFNAELEPVTTLSTPANVSYDMQADRNRDYVYVSDVLNQYHEIDVTTNTLARTIAPQGLRGPIFNINRDKLYTVTSSLGQLSVIDKTTGAVLQDMSIPVSAYPSGRWITRSTGCVGETTAFQFTVYPEEVVVPEIYVTAATGSIATCENTQPQSPTDRQQFIVWGSGLSDKLVVTAPTGFEIGLSSGGSFTNSLQLTPVNGNLTTTNIFVRITSFSPVAVRSGIVSITSAGATSRTVAVEGNIRAIPVLEAATLSTGTVGSSYSYTNLAGQAGVIFTAVGLPAGLTLNTNGAITGTPTTGLTNHQFSIKADNGSCSITALFTITINKGTATIGISNTSTVYNGSGKSVTVTTTPAGLPATVTYDGSTTMQVNAGTYAVLVNINSANYQGSATSSLVIAKANASVSINNTGQTYTGQSRPVGVTTVPAGLPVTVTYNGSATVPINTGTYPVQVTVNSANYTGSQTGSLVVSKQPLDITTQNKSRLYGETNPEFTVSYAGFVNGETVAVLDELPTVSTTAISSSDAGQYAITVTGGSDNNYSLVLHPGILTIGKLDQAISFSEIDDQTTQSAPFTVTATVSTGLPVTFSIVSGPATISGNTVTLTGDPGEVTVRATQTGTVNFNTASADQQFTVTLVLGEDPKYKASVKIYPNPASHRVAITIPAELVHAQVELINAQGVATLARNFSGKETLELALEGLPQGVYIMRIKSDKTILTRKLVIR